MWRVVLGLGGLLVTITACGGQMVGGPSEQEEAPSDSPGSDGSGAKSSGRDPVPDTDLGDCVQGPLETYAAPCPWVAKGRCYDERSMACNCACPRTRNSQCVSGFEDGPDGHVAVSCH